MADEKWLSIIFYLDSIRYFEKKCPKSCFKYKKRKKWNNTIKKEWNKWKKRNKH